MKAISLWQPWASALFAQQLIFNGDKIGVRPLKTYETRSWPMPESLVGQEVAIHAALRRTRDEKDFWLMYVKSLYGNSIACQAFRRIGIDSFEGLPRGCIIGTVVFNSGIRTEKVRLELSADDIEFDWGNYSDGRWAWPQVSSKRFESPILCKGHQGFFNWEPPQTN